MKKSIRGISFVDKFKESCLYKELYLQHRNELFIAIRNEYLNIYYNNISIAKVSYTQGNMIRCEINEYYFTGISNSPMLTLCSEDEIREKIIGCYDTIKANSDKKSNEEKKSQSALFIMNNRNVESEWYCTDVEWRRPADAEHLDFNARFDIIAITKKSPYRIAIIELKYGRKAVGGDSGIRKHIEDFYSFGKYNYFEIFKRETKAILNNLSDLDSDFPEELKHLRMDQIASKPEFYIITLDNNAYDTLCTPKQTVGGYLFDDATRWNSPRVSCKTVESVFGDVTDPNNDKVYVKFLFSPKTIEDLKEMCKIDIINDAMYDLPSREQHTSMPKYSNNSTERTSSNYKKKEQVRQLELMKNTTLFHGDCGGGEFLNKTWEFCLLDSRNNIFEDIVDDCIDYFKNEQIVFWGSNGIPNHILSSQVACLNHLFAIRNDRDLVLKLAQMLVGHEVEDVEPVECDKSCPYIAFEVTSSKDYLNEKYVKRGANCTSVDAVIIARMKGGHKMLIPIEWKYTEGKEYNIDKSGTEGSGKERLRRYTDLINASNQLLTISGGYLNTVYFVEPFYQLMRQTLWAEQIIAHKSVEPIKADDFVHVHVMPKENATLLHRRYRYSEMGLEETWRNLILDQSKYKWIEPKNIVKLIDESGRYAKLVQYLNLRYGY